MLISRRGAITAAVATGALAAVAGTAATAAKTLPSWRPGPRRDAILAFVAAVTTKGSPDYVAPAERIAVFDNDGTLWAEQPVYFQFFYVLDQIRAMAPQHPEWANKEPYAAALKGDIKGVMAGGEHAILELVAATHSGMTTEAFDRSVRAWLATARHPQTKRLFTDMTYAPMVELLGYLRANGFKTFIVSGGGIAFIRAFAERAYGIPPEQVIGSSSKAKFETQGGKPALVKQADLFFFDDGPGKPVAIEHHIGRRPIAAFGNSDGDLAMLQWTAAGPGKRLAAYVHHDDAAREWAYDRKSAIGKLDKGLDEAKARNWVVIDMAADWSRIYA